jgi:hypothetical protein
LPETETIDTISRTSGEQPGRRRRSHRKSSKAAYERRRRMKSIALWLVLGAIGVIGITAIAILAGQSSS